MVHRWWVRQLVVCKHVSAKKHPEAIYVQCYAHKLNLILCYTCKAIPEATDFFDLLESVYSFFNVRLSTMTICCYSETARIGKKTTQPAGHARCDRLTPCWTTSLLCLESIHTAIAVGLWSKLCKLASVYMLVMLKNLLAITEGLHKDLQRETVAQVL